LQFIEDAEFHDVSPATGIFEQCIRGESQVQQAKSSSPSPAGQVLSTKSLSQDRPLPIFGRLDPDQRRRGFVAYGFGRQRP
jgi:hypothetical protein